MTTPAPYREGMATKAICPTCKKVVAATFALRDVPLSSLCSDVQEGYVTDILVSCCDVCGEVVGIPQQSVEAVQLAFAKHRPFELEVLP